MMKKKLISEIKPLDLENLIKMESSSRWNDT
jgi:hypothetical protein